MASVIAVSMIVSWGPAVGSVAAAAPFTPRLNCPAESFPPAHTPRTSAGKSYRAPFTATLAGGSLAIVSSKSMFGVTFGYGGTLYGEACGLLTLPSLGGGITGNPGYGDNVPYDTSKYNNNFILHGPPACKARSTPTDPSCASELTPVPVALTVKGTGVDAIDGYGSADGAITAQIDPTPAANGGFNIDLHTTAKATAVIDPGAVIKMLVGPGLPPLPTALQGLVDAVLALGAKATGGECTLAVGDLRATGLPAAEVGTNTSPIDLTTQTSGKLTGSPVTGPVTAGVAKTVGNTFVSPAISSNMPPSPGALNAGTKPSTLCTTASAALFNSLLGLPAGPGDSTFLAPVTFAANVTS